jgi:hypothetical protein
MGGSNDRGELGARQHVEQDFLLVIGEVKHRVQVAVRA